jgi:hypothetical protein
VVPLAVGQKVLAAHPKTGEIKTGSILTSEGGEFDIRFDNPELGIVLIKDYNIIAIDDSKISVKLIEPEGQQNSGSEVLAIRSGSYLARQRSTICSLKVVMLAKSALVEEKMKAISSEQTAYLNVTYISMALLIALLSKKNMLLKYIIKCDLEVDSKKNLSKEYKEKLAWIVT